MPGAQARLLNAAQQGIPLVPRPFEALAEATGLVEEAVIRLLDGAYAVGLVRETSGIFNAAAFGYHTCLVAAQCPPGDLERVAVAVSAHPGVSHNYGRDHVFNLWFTISVPPEASLEDEIARLVGECHYRSFPALKTYKLGVRLDMEADAAAASGRWREPQRVETDAGTIAAVQALQDDLPRVQRPFRTLAERHGLAEETLLQTAERLLQAGAMRRYACVLRQSAAGYTANIMTAWEADEKEADRVAAVFTASPHVSHCYRRSVWPDWPYALFAMFHSRTEQGCLAAIDQAAQQLPGRKFLMLRTVREYKKARGRLFASA